MTTRIYIDNQTNIQFRLTDGDGHKYANIMPISYYSLDLPYYGIGGKLERVFTMTSRTYASPGIIRFSINNYGFLSAYNIPVPIKDSIVKTTTTSSSTANVSTLTTLNPSTPIQLTNTANNIITPTSTTTTTQTVGLIASEPIITTVQKTSVNIPMDVNVAITKQNTNYIQSNSNLGMSTNVVPTKFVSNINNQTFNTLVVFTGFTYDRTNSQ